ncbi:DUF6622 family protein [Glaciimonas soli]|uniref:DUF1453 domain-containing protein n=1 Tax=Glaciimonas soli TaxID=2590999 RepID=A0A843YS11_9BURK|nr:DUF6622 family protein [Glaciimonas soli]MQR00323.1 hypothetical protein [Glaciimonas soli]
MSAILHGTPLWVWGILALLVSRGLAATNPNTVTTMRLLLLPLAFSLWTAYSLSHMTEITLPMLTALTSGLLLGATVGWRLYAGMEGFHYDRENQLIHRPGTWLMLIVSLFSFLLKFSLAISLARNAALVADPRFVLINGALVGLSCGLLWGVVLTQFLLAWRAASAPAATSSHAAEGAARWNS